MWNAVMTDMIGEERAKQFADDDFLSGFYCLGCKDLFGPSQEVIEGNAIRFTYSDGSFELVTAESGFYYSADKEWSCPAYVFDYDEFHEFVYLWGKGVAQTNY